MMGKGVIKISGSMYRDRWDICWQIFKEFRPMHIKYSDTEYDTWVFLGESDQFEENTNEGEVLQYETLCSIDEAGCVVTKFVKS